MTAYIGSIILIGVLITAIIMTVWEEKHKDKDW